MLNPAHVPLAENWRALYVAICGMVHLHTKKGSRLVRDPLHHFLFPSMHRALSALPRSPS